MMNLQACCKREVRELVAKVECYRNALSGDAESENGVTHICKARFCTLDLSSVNTTKQTVCLELVSATAVDLPAVCVCPRGHHQHGPG